MTTIVYDRRTKTFVADTRGTKGGLKTRLTKLQSLPNGDFFAGCGMHSICLQVFAWFAGGCNPKEKPEIDPADDVFEGILVKADGAAYVLEARLVPIPVEDDFVAIGSGGDYALGALASGKTAVEALEVASQLDAFTGPPYHVVQLDQPTPTPPKPERRGRKKVVA